MNKRGFTLVEILATIVIIALVTIIGTVSVNGIRKRISQKIFASKLELVVTSAKSWGQDNKESLTEVLNVNGVNYSGKTITIAYLLNTKYITDEEKNKINDNDDIDISSTQLYVYKDNNRVYSCIVTSSIRSTDSSTYDKYKC